MPDLDLLICGSGVAGLSAAVQAAETHGLRVGVLTKAEMHQATTRWAQGGVAAVLGGADPDSTDLHRADTLGAGAGLCDADAVRVLVDEGPGRVNELIALGAMFDRDEQGRYALAQEGGHSHARVLHAGGAATGVEIERALVAAVEETAAAVYEHHFALELLMGPGGCQGVRALDRAGGHVEVRAGNVLLATGGVGQLFSVTTNPLEATGDGVAMSLRAGAAAADLEFVQFHPTALHHPAMPRPLLSEALRGHGALVRDRNGERFVDELLPRDVVSRAMSARMVEQGVEHLWLDATGLEDFDKRFPTIARALDEAGLDPARDWLPIAPAAHYLCGGVVVDLDGATSVPGLWAAGEVACNGVHGANRLASNSLLDGMVFGPRVVEAIDQGKRGPSPTGAMRAVLAVLDGPAIEGLGADPVIRGRRLELSSEGGDASPQSGGVETARDALQWAMAAHAGAVRSADSLAVAEAAVGQAYAEAAVAPLGVAAFELRNLADVGRALVTAAIARTESRGAHTRSDFPDTDDHLRIRFVTQRPTSVRGSTL